MAERRTGWMDEARRRVGAWLGGRRALQPRVGDPAGGTEGAVHRHAGQPPMREEPSDATPGLPTYGPEDGTARAEPESDRVRRPRPAADDQGLATGSTDRPEGEPGTA